MTAIEQAFRERFPKAEVYVHNARRYYLRISRADITAACRLLHQELGCRLSICTGIDTREGYEILYHFSDDRLGALYTLKVLVPKDDPKIESQGAWFPAAEWIEREMAELLGMEFVGHPNPIPFLTSDTDWDPARRPLRRDYEHRADQHEK